MNGVGITTHFIHGPPFLRHQIGTIGCSADPWPGVCVIPSLFHLEGANKRKKTPGRPRKTDEVDESRSRTLSRG